MDDLAIRAVGLGKRYRVGQVESASARLRRYVANRERESLWALSDVTFDVEEGERVGVVGRNGAGKSTLLKLLARITEPTAGYADIRGRVGALLEVGTGFHPELTGRENVYLNGALLGMRKAEVTRKFDEIVDFSGVERHIDTPVKWYSSGMYVRLAFAVAAHLEPEILIVDEVLAVGDAEFQKKCLARMSEVATDGRTVLFVSHNMQAVRRLCDRAILLDGGKIVADADAQSVSRSYLESVDSIGAGRRRFDVPVERPGDEFCRVLEVRVSDDSGRPGASFFSSRPLHVTIEFDLATTHPSFSVGFDVTTVDGVLVFHSLHRDLPEGAAPRLVPGRNALQAVVPAGLLNAGRYLINLRVSLLDRRRIAWVDGVLHFDVLADHGDSFFFGSRSRPGVIAPVLEWSAVEPSTDVATAAEHGASTVAS